MKFLRTGVIALGLLGAVGAGATLAPTAYGQSRARVEPFDVRVFATGGSRIGVSVSDLDTSTDAPEFGFTRFIGWNDQGTTGLVAAMSADFKQEWLWSLDAATGEMKLLSDNRSTTTAGPLPHISSP